MSQKHPGRDRDRAAKNRRKKQALLKKERTEKREKIRDAKK